MNTIRVTLEIPGSILTTLHQDPESLGRELRLAAAVKWYEIRLLSQAQAAEVAGLSRTEFLAALERFSASPFQYGAEEIKAESAEQ
jgi:predicted HTH domain antitoxin